MDEKPALSESLTEAESRMLQSILRNSRRDIERISIQSETEPMTVKIRMFGLRPVEIPHEGAMKMKDTDWKQFFSEHPPLI